MSKTTEPAVSTLENVKSLDDKLDVKEQEQEQAAKDGTAVETSITLRQAFSYYKKAVAWCFCISLLTIMEGYDMMIVNSSYGLPQFQKSFGEQLPNGKYSVPARWQLGISLATVVGLIIGTFSNGYFADRYGPRKVIMVCLFSLNGTIFISFFAKSPGMLLAGEFLCAIPWGFFAGGVPAYAAEVCPLKLRGYLTTYVNLCWVMGNILGTGIIRAFIGLPDEWAWRIPFGIQWVWPVPLFIATYFAPESPWWLVKKDRYEEAEKTLDRLVTAPPGAINNASTVAMMQHTIELERSLNIGTSYLECFKGTNLRRTEIAMIAWGCQILPGFSIQNYITYFFTLAGVPAQEAFKLALGNFSLAFVGTVSSWFTQTYFGRRTIYITGLCFMLPIMWIVGFLELASSPTTRWVQAGLLMFWFLCYGTTIGPIPYVIAAEVGASQLRVKTICLGRNTYYFLNFINVIAAPYMLNPVEGNLKGKAAFPAAVSTVCLLIWAYFRLPEMKGRTPEELDKLFDRKVPARQFKKEGEILASERDSD